MTVFGRNMTRVPTRSDLSTRFWDVFSAFKSSRSGLLNAAATESE
jgi:hypothetical protein